MKFITMHKNPDRLERRVESLEGELRQEQDRLAKVRGNLMKLEERYKKAVARGHRLQLEVNRLRKKAAGYDQD